MPRPLIRRLAREQSANERLSDSPFEELANRLSIMVWRQDATSRLTFLNHAWYEFTEMPYSVSTLSYEAWKQIVHPDDYPGMIEAIATANRDQSKYTFDVRIRPLTGDDGSYRWFRCEAAPEFVGDAFDGWIGYQTDIHDAYVGSAMFERLFTSEVIGMFVTRVGGNIITANDNFLRMIGYTREELNRGAINWRAMTPPEWDAVDERAIELLRRSSVVPPFEKEYLRKDGSRIPLLIGVSSLPGPHEQVVCYALDLSLIKTAEQRLASTNALVAQSEHQFREIANAIPVMTWTATADGWIDWYNTPWLEYTGLSLEELLGWGWQNVHHPDYFPIVMQRWPTSIATGTPFEMEFPLKGHDGKYRWFLTRVVPVKNDAGEIVRWYGSNVDIQTQKESLKRAQWISEMLQQDFVPENLPRNEKVRFDSVYVPAQKDALVGGDWFEAIELPTGNFMVSVGDVAGHGIEASVIAGKLRQAVLTASMLTEDPVEILETANRILRLQYPDVYVTALVGFINRECTEFRYASAGHPSPMIAYESEMPPRTLPYGGIPLGVDDRLSIHIHRCDILPDSVLALYTDGLTEFSRDVQLAEHAIGTAVAALVGATTMNKPATVVKDAVIGAASPPDDIALLIAQFSHVTNLEPVDAPVALEKFWRFHSSDAYTTHRARHEIMEYIRLLAADDQDLSAAHLVLGEVLANTARHAPGLVDIHCDWHNEYPRVIVSDTGPGIDTLDSDLPADLLQENGRGMFLIMTLAHDVRVQPRQGGGTDFLFTLAVQRRAI